MPTAAPTTLDLARAARLFHALSDETRLAVLAMLRDGVPDAVRRSMELLVGCVAGALEEGEFLRLLAEVGFADASIEPTRVYGAEDARAFLAEAAADATALADQVDGKVMAGFVRATKPAAAPCCGPSCCA